VQRIYIFIRYYYHARSNTWGGQHESRKRPKKIEAGLIGRAGRQAIELEDLARESKRWKSRKATIKKLRETPR